MHRWSWLSYDGISLVLALSVIAGVVLAYGADNSDSRQSPLKSVGSAFQPGEILEYEVSWLGITAGKSYMTVDSPEMLRDRLVWPLRSGAETSGLVKKLYRIDNKTVSYLDPAFCYPLRFEVDQFSGGRDERVAVNFYQDEHKVEWSRSYNNKDSEGTRDIKPGVQDSLSTIYFLRNHQLVIGQSIKIPLFESRKKWLLQADVIKMETLTVPAGKFTTLKIKPIMLPESEGEPKGSMVLWLSDDEHHVPVQINSEVAVGSIVMKLAKYDYGLQQDEKAATE
ncbi:DUF3108 domain-containing protein [bacterium]|nr:DUF3108 domain-containing protein [bacterium]